MALDKKELKKKLQELTDDDKPAFLEVVKELFGGSDDDLTAQVKKLAEEVAELKKPKPVSKGTGWPW